MYLSKDTWGIRGKLFYGLRMDRDSRIPIAVGSQPLTNPRDLSWVTSMKSPIPSGKQLTHPRTLNKAASRPKVLSFPLFCMPLCLSVIWGLPLHSQPLPLIPYENSWSHFWDLVVWHPLCFPWNYIIALQIPFRWEEYFGFFKVLKWLDIWIREVLTDPRSTTAITYVTVFKVNSY